MAFKADYGNGELGDVSSVLSTINSYAEVTALNSTSITINSSTKFDGTATFKVGAKILLHVSAVVATDKTYLGNWMLANVTAIDSNVLTLDKDPTTCIPSEDLANYHVQAIAVAQYKNLTLETGTNISPPAFSTSSYHGGIVAFMCSESLTFAGGNISLTDRGVPPASKALRPTTQNDVAADTATYAGWENSDTHIHFLLNSGDGAAFIEAKHMTCHDDSRIGNTATYGCQFFRGASSSVTYNETKPTGVTNVGGSTILIAADTIDNFGHKMLAKYRLSTATAGQGICRCFIASETKLRNDEGLYAYDCISKPARIKNLNIKDFGNGSYGDLSGVTTQLNNFAQITDIDGKNITYTGKTTAGLAQIGAGSLVMIHFNHKGNINVVDAGKFILARVLSDNGTVLTVDTQPPAISTTDYAAQIVSIPEANNFTLAVENKATQVFDGTKGGICAIAVKNTCDLSNGKLWVQAGNKFAYAREGLAVIGNAQDSDKLPIGHGFGSIFILAQNLTVNNKTRIGNTYDGSGRCSFLGDSGNSASALQRNMSYAGSNGQSGKQGAHVMIIADTITGFNQSVEVTGGYFWNSETQGGAGYGGGGGGYNHGGGGTSTAGGSSGWCFIYCNNAINQDTDGTILAN